ncbi:MAG: hypothetical protein IJ523_01880 [Succinivibrionaceae bacterium]|nr:hypothetical protein [Succinivibrionaceae bacterium]
MKNSISIEEARRLRAALDDYISGRTDDSACSGIIGSIARRAAQEVPDRQPGDDPKTATRCIVSSKPQETLGAPPEAMRQTGPESIQTAEPLPSAERFASEELLPSAEIHPAAAEPAVSEVRHQRLTSPEVQIGDESNAARQAEAAPEATAGDFFPKTGGIPLPDKPTGSSLSSGPRFADFGDLDAHDKEKPSSRSGTEKPQAFPGDERLMRIPAADERLPAQPEAMAASSKNADESGIETSGGATGRVGVYESALTSGLRKQSRAGESAEDGFKSPRAAERRPETQHEETRPKPQIRECIRGREDSQSGSSFEMFTGKMLSGIFAAVLLVIGFIFTARAVNFTFGPMSRFAGMAALSIGMILWGLGGKKESGEDRSRAVVCGIGFSLLYATTASACFVFDLIHPYLWAPATMLWSLAAAASAARRHGFMFLLAQLGVIISMPLGASTGDLSPFQTLLLAFSAQMPISFLALKRGDIRLGTCTMSGVFMMLAQYLAMSRFQGGNATHMHMAALMGGAALLIAMFSARQASPEEKRQSGQGLFRFSAFLCAVICLEFLRLASGCRGILSAVMPQRGILLTEMARARLESGHAELVSLDTSQLKLLPTLLAAGLYSAVAVWAETTEKSFSAGARLLKMPLLVALLAMAAMPLAFFLLPIAADGPENSGIQHFPLLLPLIVLVHVAIAALKNDENSRKLAGILTLLLTAPAAAAPLACGAPSVGIVTLGAMIALGASMMVSNNLQELMKADSSLMKAVLPGFALLLTALAWVQSSSAVATTVTETVCALIAAAICLVPAWKDMFSADAYRASLPLALLWTGTLALVSPVAANAIGGDWGNLFYAFAAFGLLELTRRLPAFRRNDHGAENPAAGYLLAPCLAGMYGLFLRTVPLLTYEQYEILPHALLRLIPDAGDPAEVSLPLVIASCLLLALFFFSKSLRDLRAGMNSSNLAYLCFSLLATIPAVVAALDGCSSATFLQGTAMLIFALPALLLSLAPREYNEDDEQTRRAVIRLIMLWAPGLFLAYVLLSHLIPPSYLPLAASLAICLPLAVAGRRAAFKPLASRRLLYGLPAALTIGTLFVLTSGWNKSAAVQSAILPASWPSWPTYAASSLALACGLFLGLAPGRGEGGDRARAAGLCAATILSGLMILAFGFDTAELKIQAAAISAAVLPYILTGASRKPEERGELYAATARLATLWAVALFAVYCITLHLISPLALMLSIMAATFALCLHASKTLRTAEGGESRIPLFLLPAVALLSLIYLLTSDYSSVLAVQRALAGDHLPAGALWLASTALFALPYLADFRVRTVHPLRGMNLAANCLRGLIPAVAICMSFFEDPALTWVGIAILSASALLLATYLIRQSDIEARPAVHRGVETAILWAGTLYATFCIAEYLSGASTLPLS